MDSLLNFAKLYRADTLHYLNSSVADFGSNVYKKFVRNFEFDDRIKKSLQERNSKFYLLISRRSDSKKSNEKWKDVLSKNQMKRMYENEGLVIGFMKVITIAGKQYVEELESRINSEYVEDEILYKYGKEISPLKITESNAGFWFDYYKVMDFVDGSYNLEQASCPETIIKNEYLKAINKLIKHYKIYNTIYWSALREYYKKKEIFTKIARKIFYGPDLDFFIEETWCDFSEEQMFETKRYITI